MSLSMTISFSAAPEPESWRVDCAIVFAIDGEPDGEERFVVADGLDEKEAETLVAVLVDGFPAHALTWPGPGKWILASAEDA